jgi:hypothetical protein
MITLCVVIAYGGAYVYTPASSKGYANYYFGMILRPIDSLASRYGGVIKTPDKGDKGPAPDEKADESQKAEGITVNAFTVVKENWLIGVGYNPIRGEFTGDSYFVDILHNGGVVGFILFSGLFCLLFFKSLSKKKFEKNVILAGIALCCLSMPILSYSFSIPFLAYVLKDGKDIDPML